MKLLIVAPGFAPPWTEGCKNFIRDLIPELQARVELRILSATVSSVPAPGSVSFPVTYTATRYKSTQLLVLLRALKRQLSTADRPDVVVHFPYGTFDGLRGLANTHSVIRTHRLVTRAGIACITLLYSMVGGNLSALSARVPTIATVAIEGWPGYAVNTGIRISDEMPPATPRNMRELLFMAGHHENKPALLKNILHTRGLMDVIRIGESLGKNGFRLTIAAPLLQHPERRAELAAMLRREAPSLPVQMMGEADVYELFRRHSLYLFPYRQNHNVFIPTSVLEAMASGIPVVISDLPMFRPLIGSENKFSLSYPAGSLEGLLHAILEAQSNIEMTYERADQATRHMRREWTAQRSAEQLLSVASKLLADR